MTSSDPMVTALNQLIVELTEHADSMRDVLAVIVNRGAVDDDLLSIAVGCVARYDNFVKEC